MSFEPFVIEAPAKVNLALHVLGRRDDGYHELDSIVAFADRGDSLRFAPATWRPVQAGDNAAAMSATALREPPGVAIVETRDIAAAAVSGDQP